MDLQKEIKNLMQDVVSQNLKISEIEQTLKIQKEEIEDLRRKIETIS